MYQHKLTYSMLNRSDQAVRQYCSHQHWFWFWKCHPKYHRILTHAGTLPLTHKLKSTESIFARLSLVLGLGSREDLKLQMGLPLWWYHASYSVPQTDQFSRRVWTGKLLGLLREAKHPYSICQSPNLNTGRRKGFWWWHSSWCTSHCSRMDTALSKILMVLAMLV